MAVDGGSIVDLGAIGGLLREEHRFVCGDRVGEIAIGEGCFGKPGFIQSRNVVPVARETLTTQPFLQAKEN